MRPRNERLVWIRRLSHALLKTNLKLNDDVDVARDDAPLFTSNAKTSCSMRKTNAIRTHARTHFSHGDSNQRACLSLCVHFYQQTHRQNNK